MTPREPSPAKTSAILILCTLALGAGVTAQKIPDTRLIQINVLAASKSGSSDLADLPANTRKAIEDIREFLPFKSYRILDTSLVRSLVPQNQNFVRRMSRTYMNGPNDSKLEVRLFITSEGEGSALYVHEFEVRPSTPEVQLLTPEQERQVDPDSEPKVAIAPMMARGPLISTSFTAEVGKTVVVGSSRLNGGEEALIVLFTALP